MSRNITAPGHNIMTGGQSAMGIENSYYAHWKERPQSEMTSILASLGLNLCPKVSEDNA